MARRPAHGYVVEREGKRGTSFAIWYRFNGKRIYKTLGRSQDGYRRRDAERELQNVLAAINQGQHSEPVEETFHEFVSEWLHRKEPELKPSTYGEYRDTIEVHLSPYFGDYMLSQIGVELVDNYKAHKLREGRLSPYSVNKTLTRLSQVLEEARAYGRVQHNPVRDVRRLKVSKPATNYLEPEQAVALLAEIPARYRPLFDVLIFAGLRIGEAVGLQWQDVDFTNNVLWLRRTIYRGQVQVGTKSGEEEASAEMPSELAQVLAEHQLREHDAGRGTGWVFSAAPRQRTALPEGLVVDGRVPLNGANVRRRILATAKDRANTKLVEADEAPIGRLTLHDLRRSCCSLLFESGATLPAVMARMRHKDERMTLRVYAKRIKASSEDVDTAFAQLLAGNKPATNGDEAEPAADAKGAEAAV